MPLELCLQISMAAFAAMGLVETAAPTDKPVEVEIGGDIWWVNRDSRGGLWINGRRKDEDNEAPVAPSTPAGAVVTDGAAAVGATSSPVTESSAEIFTPTPATNEPNENQGILSLVRPHLQEAKAGTFASDVCDLAPAVGKGPEEFVAALVAAGLKKPEKPRERPVYVDHAGEAFWLSRTPDDALVLNAKVSKAASGAKRSKSKKDDE